MQRLHHTTNYFFISIIIHSVIFFCLCTYFLDSKKKFSTSENFLDSFIVTQKNIGSPSIDIKSQNNQMNQSKNKIIHDKSFQSNKLTNKTISTNSHLINTYQNNAKTEKSFSSLVQLLHEKILSKQHYPLMAIEMENEGMVTLKFTLLTDGGITNVNIAKSSGTKLLDDAALKALGEAVPFQEVAQYLQSAKDFEVDIQFRLTK